MFRFKLFSFKVKKWPKRQQWQYFFKVLSKKEKYTFLFFFLLAAGSLFYLLLTFYFKNTKIVPTRGGIYIEGVLGQPRFINPIYANSDTDRDLTQLIYSGLFKYNEKMELVPDLVQKYQIEDSGRTYILYLKENVWWQDKTPLTADDVIFTIKTIQNPEYKSVLRANWVGVDAEKLSEFAVKFSINQPYNSFLENLTLKILPSHLWKEIPAENFPLEIYNLKPIGSGPYKIKELNKDKNNQIRALILVPNPLYEGKYPYISELKFLFFNKEDNLIKAAKNGEISGFSISSLEKIKNKDYWNIYHLLLPRYFSVFLNANKSKPLSDPLVRQALNYGLNKIELVKKVLDIKEDELADKKIVNSPILPSVYGFTQPSVVYDFNPEKSKNILEEAGYRETGQGPRKKIVQREPSFQFKSNLRLNYQGSEVRELQKCLAKFSDIYPDAEITGFFGKKTQKAVVRFQEKYSQDILEPEGLKQGNGEVKARTRAKLNELCFDSSPEEIPLKFSLVTVDQPQLLQLASILQDQWKNIGADVEIIKVPISTLETDYIKPRNYQALLFGEVLGAIPDPLPFWHSSQKRNPGLNLAMYENKEADKLLEEIRKSQDSKERADKLDAFQNILLKDAPALFLFAPDYIYFVSKEVKDIKVQKIVDPSKRFVGIEEWYIKTKRVWK